MFSAIGRYQIIRPLGAGGMANVYLARDPDLGRMVAVKMMSAGLLDATRLARFMVEAQAVAQLEHPAIVPLYDYGEQDGRPYLIMRHMAGGSLADRLVQRTFALGEAIAVIERIAASLDYAHTRGIIHRDVKPGNILFDEAGAAYLADFGIARIIRPAAGASLTSTGAIIGTLTYMSPEQALGRLLDGRSDVYSLGVVLFEMLTGDVPYAAESVIQQAMLHIHAPIPSVRSRRPDLPPTLQHVIDRVLAKLPEDRYQTAGEMAADLRRIADNYSNDLAYYPTPALPAPTVALPAPTVALPAPTATAGTFPILLKLALLLTAVLPLLLLLSRYAAGPQSANATRIAAHNEQLVMASRTAAAAGAMTTTAEALAPTSTPLPPTETPPSTATPQSPPSDLIAVVNLIQREQPDGKVITSAELEFQSLGLGEMEVIAPEVMTMGHSDTVSLRIVPGSALPSGQSITIYPDDSDEVEPTPRVNSPIEIYPWMTATMKGGLAYLVESTSSDTQPVLSSAPTVWTWLVTPLEPGEHQLTLTIAVPVRVSGTGGVITTNQIRVLPLDVQIERGFGFWLAWAAIIFVVFVLLYSLYRYFVLPRWREAQYASDKALVALVDDLDKGLIEEEAKDLAFRMNYEYENLDVGNKKTKLRSLVIKCARRKRIDELVSKAREINKSADFLSNYRAATNVESGKQDQASS